MLQDPQTIIAIFLTMFFAGAVKGVIGLGLPTIGLGILTTIIGLQEAIVLMLVPALVTNFWQSLRGGHLSAIIQRLWPLLLSSALMVWPGVLLLSLVNVSVTTMILGALLTAYSLVNLFGFRIAVSEKIECPAGIGIGLINGLVTGMTGSLGIPGILLLQALNFDRHVLVQAMGILFVSSTLMLALSMQVHGMLCADLSFVSLLALAPTVVGMVFGSRLRGYLSEVQFRQAFFWFLLLLGIYIVMRAIGS